MNSLGDYLKQAREKKGVSLEHLASQTKIQEHHLLALESEDFANLPAKVFAKGFVRSYAKALGLDEEEALQSFLQTSGTFYEQHQPEQTQPHVQVTLEAPPRQGMNWSLIFGVIVIIAALSIWYGFPKQQETPITQSEPEKAPPIELIEEPIPHPTSQESITPITPIDSVPPPPAPQTPIPAQPVAKPLPATPGKPPSPTSPIPAVEETRPDRSQTLEIEAIQLTWVVVKSDEEAPNEALLQPGQRITWQAENQFILTLGNAAGVVITLNGQLQGPFGKPGQVVRDIRLRR